RFSRIQSSSSIIETLIAAAIIQPCATPTLPLFLDVGNLHEHVGARKPQAPTSKLQRNPKHQYPTSKPKLLPQALLVFEVGFFWSLELGCWCFSGAWMLVLGAYFPFASILILVPSP